MKIFISTGIRPKDRDYQASLPPIDDEAPHMAVEKENIEPEKLQGSTLDGTPDNKKRTIDDTTIETEE
jgi:hypothetical protein